MIHIKHVFNISAKCIDHYTKLRVHNADSSDQKVIDSRLEAIVNRMFQRCFQDGQYKQAVGIALETRRMDIFETAIMQSVITFSLLINHFLKYFYLIHLIKNLRLSQLHFMSFIYDKYL